MVLILRVQRSQVVGTFQIVETSANRRIAEATPTQVVELGEQSLC